jgi:anaphase-promoting complex subunit 4
MGLENNKAAHSIRVSDDSSCEIIHIGWSWNQVGKPRGAKAKPETGSWRDLLSKELDVGKNAAVLDLPRELTFLEVDTALPKISPLPSGSAGEGYDFSPGDKQAARRPSNNCVGKMLWCSP